VNTIAGYFDIHFSAGIGQWIRNDLRIRIYHHLRRLSLSYYLTRRIGVILSSIADDMAPTQSFAALGMLEMVIDPLTITRTFVVMSALRWDFGTTKVRKRQADIGVEVAS
jgi:ABC-type multidrug transport system fused ATPase/permease subunit